MDGEQRSAIFDVAFVTFGLVFGNAHADERSGDSAYGSADTETGERANDGTSGDERPDAGNRERTETRRAGQAFRR